MLTVVSSPPVSTPSASPASSTSLTESPYSARIAPISPGRARRAGGRRLSQQLDGLLDVSSERAPSLKSKRAALSRWNSAWSVVVDAEQFHDHAGRDGQREVLLQVDQRRPAPTAASTSSSASSMISRIRGSRAASARVVKCARQHVAQPGVRRRVGEAEAARVLLGGDADLADHVAEVVAEGLRVGGEDRPGLVVAGHQPAPQAERHLEPADRLAVAEPAEFGHRVEADAAQRHQRFVGKAGEQRGRVGAAGAGQPHQQAEQPATRSAGRFGPPHGESALLRQIQFHDHRYMLRGRIAGMGWLGARRTKAWMRRLY